MLTDSLAQLPQFVQNYLFFAWLHNQKKHDTAQSDAFEYSQL